MGLSDARLGLSPLFKRVAYSYLLKGLGRHAIELEFLHDYDEVLVEELYKWMPNPETKEEYGAALRVVFLKENRRMRWVEFSMRCIGGGGDPVVRIL